MNKKERSNNQELVNRNLELIVSSSNYQLAQEDRELLNSDGMRGVRMLLEITKPEKILEDQKILSTIIVFGGANLSDKASIDVKLEIAENSLIKNQTSIKLLREIKRLRNLRSMSHYYDSAREFARIVSRQNQKADCNSHVIVTGGGPGIMEAANRGAFDADCKSIGLNISLPNEQHPNPYITPGLCLKFNYFALRKFHFIMRSVAAVFFPGGFGTFDELFELLTLRQTGMKNQIPIILFGRDYWSKVIDFQFLSDYGLISDDDLSLFQYADTPDEVLEIVMA